MKIINRKNFWQVFCLIFTPISLIGTCIDIAYKGGVNYSQFNTLGIAAACFVAIFILSNSYRMETLSPLAVIVIQYGMAVACYMFLTWLSSFWDPVDAAGYRDMFVSFSIVYAIGAVIYYLRLQKEIRRQNEELQEIKKLKKDGSLTNFKSNLNKN